MSMKEKNIYDRYQRQIILPELGQEGQQKLLEAKVLVIGAGGLGCPALQYLAAAGVGTIGIVDDDRVALSNLHRQILYTVDDIGLSKAERARDFLQRLNPGIEIIAYDQRLTVQNACNIFSAFDIILDGSDNFSTRYLVNDACVLLKKPLVYGAISQFEGQVSVFNHYRDGEEAPANYRDLFPEPPREDEVLNCAEAGVLGVLPGVIGTMQATEVIKLITGLGEPLVNRLLTYNALSSELFELSISPKPETIAMIPASEAAFRKMNYDWLCAAQANSLEIETDYFDQLLDKDAVEIIDVREADEFPRVSEFKHRRISLQRIPDEAGSLQAGTIVLFCQTGKRSRQAANLLSGIFGKGRKVHSLKGGILAWKEKQEAQAE